jgi:hypothetical protein
MERCLLVALMLFPFAVLIVAAWPILPGTTATFLTAVVGYGAWLAHQRIRERHGDSESLVHK